MRLLDAKDVRKDKNDQQLRDILRIRELRELEERERKKLIKTQADFSSMMAENKIKWANEEEEHLKDIQRRKREIEQLEEKKLNMLVPFDILKDGVYTDMQDAEQFLATLREREAKAEELSELLQDRLDEVGEREQDIISREQKAFVREDSVKRQEQANIANTEILNQQMREFLEVRSKDEEERKQKHEALSLWEQSLNEQENGLKEREKKNREWAIRLEDERGVLNRAWKELERKKSA